jgi:hypothetical protein
MKKFIVSLFSNRFGIVLAALNVCYLASKAHDLRPQPLDMPFFCVNSPAMIFTMVTAEFLRIFSFDIFSRRHEILFEALLMFLAGSFVVLQWLFIAWIARTLSAKFRPKEL